MYCAPGLPLTVGDGATVGEAVTAVGRLALVRGVAVIPVLVYALFVELLEGKPRAMK